MNDFMKNFKNLPLVIQAVEDVSYKHSLASVKANGLKLQYVLKGFFTSEMCMAAVKSNGYALKFVPPEHFSEELFSVALNGPNSIFFTPTPEIQEIILITLRNKHGKDCIKYIPEEYLNHENCIEAVKLRLLNCNDVPLVHRTADFYLEVLEYYSKPTSTNLEAYKIVNICPNPDYQTTVDNLKRLKEAEANKILIKNTISQIEN